MPLTSWSWFWIGSGSSSCHWPSRCQIEGSGSIPLTFIRIREPKNIIRIQIVIRYTACSFWCRSASGSMWWFDQEADSFIKKVLKKCGARSITLNYGSGSMAYKYVYLKNVKKYFFLRMARLRPLRHLLLMVRLCLSTPSWPMAGQCLLPLPS
jgi:hypothetical protein